MKRFNRFDSLPALFRKSTAVFAALAVACVLATASPAAEVTAAFDWTVPDRFGADADSDGLIDYPTTPDAVQPESYRVDFDACGSTGDVVEFEVEVDGQPVDVFGECRFSLDFSAEGSYVVAVTAVDGAGERSTVAENVVVQDWLIVALGDS